MKTIVIDSPGLPFQIKAIHAFIAQDENGEEGVCAMLGPDGMWLPMIAADPKRLADLRPIAARLAAGTKKKIVLCRFTQREEVEVIEP